MPATAPARGRPDGAPYQNYYYFWQETFKIRRAVGMAGRTWMDDTRNRTERSTATRTICSAMTAMRARPCLPAEAVSAAEALNRAHDTSHALPTALIVFFLGRGHSFPRCAGARTSSVRSQARHAARASFKKRWGVNILAPLRLAPSDLF